MNDKLPRTGGLVISDRPQISVELVGRLDIEITVSRIGNSFDTVDTVVAMIPVDCAAEVAKAMLELVKSSKGK